VDSRHLLVHRADGAKVILETNYEIASAVRAAALQLPRKAANLDG